MKIRPQNLQVRVTQTKRIADAQEAAQRQSSFVFARLVKLVKHGAFYFGALLWNVLPLFYNVWSI